MGSRFGHALANAKPPQQNQVDGNGEDDTSAEGEGLLAAVGGLDGNDLFLYWYGTDKI